MSKTNRDITLRYVLPLLVLTVLFLVWHQSPVNAFPAGTDNFPGTSITGLVDSGTDNNAAATFESGEPDAAGVSGTASVWWSWTAVNSGQAVITTHGSDFDTTLGVYTGSAVNALTLLGENDDTTSKVTSKVTIPTTVGTVYRIQVNGKGAATGNIVLNIFNANVTQQGITAGEIPGGSVQDLYFDPNDASIVFAAVTGAGLFRSGDGGVNWTQIMLPGVANHTSRRLLVSQGTPDLMFVTDQLAGVSSTVWRSPDSGATITGVLPRSAGRATALAEGTTAGTYFAGVTTDGSNVANFYNSTNFGQTWQQVSTVGAGGSDIWDIIQLPSGRIVAGTGPLQGGGVLPPTGAIYYSDNGGVNWTLVAGSTNAVIGFAHNGTNLLMAATHNNQSTFISTSADGQTWSFNTTAFTAPGTAYSFANRSPVYHTNTDSFFVLTCEDRVFQSGSGPAYGFPPNLPANDITNGLLTPVLYNLSRHLCFAVSPATGQTILLGENRGSDGVFMTTNGGGAWTISNSGLAAQGLVKAGKSLTQDYRYCASEAGFIYFAPTNLSGWTKIYRPSTIFDMPWALTHDIADHKRLFVAFGNPQDTPGSATFRLLRCSDATTTAEDVAPFTHAGWSILANPTATSELIGALLVNGTTIFAGLCPNANPGSGNYLHVSTNGGTSWNPVTTLTCVGGVRSLAFDPTNPLIIYAGSGDRGGSTQVGGNLYPGNASGLYKSTDGGANWTYLNSNSTLNTQSPRRIVVDRNNPQRVWVQADRTSALTELHDNHIWESLDGGATWAEVGPFWGWGARGGLALTYLATEDLLILAANNGVVGRTPGTSGWLTGPNLYGDIRVLYEGSLGAGTGSGLFESATVTLTPGGGGGGGDGGGGDSGGCASGDRHGSLAWLGLIAAVAGLAAAVRLRRG